MRPARAILDGDALRHNLARVRAMAKQAKVMAVVKANAYGHGIAWVARTLGDAADAYGVACIEEALTLRRAGVSLPICLLEGFFSDDELPLLVEHDISPAIHHEAQLRSIENARLPGRLNTVWIKVDTGMHRIGFAPDEAGAVHRRLRQVKGVGEVRMMSHLAGAETADDGSTRLQIECFTPLVAATGAVGSLANSAGIIGWPASHLQWVRPGIMLYGVSPSAGRPAQALGLRPAMTLSSALIAVRRRRAGEAIGYGGTYVCPEDMPVGVAAIGYGDGYPRHAAPGTPVLVNRRRVPLIGRVSMDMITLDLRAAPDARVGDPVTLWGEGLPVEEVAASAQTIGYELLCKVAERIPRVDGR